MSKSIFLAAAIVLAAGSASIATTITSTNGPDTLPLPAGQHVIFDFDSAPTKGFITGTGTIVSGMNPGIYAAPYLDETNYMSVGGGKTTTLHLLKDAKAISLYWGSIDAYNAIAFFDEGGVLVSGYFGDAIPAAPADGSQGNPLNNRRVNFNFDGGLVRTITFNSSANAFEFDRVAVGGVPEPLTWTMLITGFGAVGMAARRRRPAVAC